MRGFLRRLMASAADAEDIAQETFLAVWEGSSGYRGGSSVRSWLCAIAWRKARTAQRSWFRSRARETDWRAKTSGEGAAAASPEDRLAVKTALMALPLDQRAAVALCLADGFSHAEAADAPGAPLGTIKSHVARGRAKLLEALSEMDLSEMNPGEMDLGETDRDATVLSESRGDLWQDGTEGGRG